MKCRAWRRKAASRLPPFLAENSRSRSCQRKALQGGVELKEVVYLQHMQEPLRRGFFASNDGQCRRPIKAGAENREGLPSDLNRVLQMRVARLEDSLDLEFPECARPLEHGQEIFGRFRFKPG